MSPAVASNTISQIHVDNIESISIFPFIIQKLCLSIENGGKGWDKQRADLAVDWYKRFLAVRAEGYVGLVPTLDIDEIWHLHILYTKDYRQDCDRIFGRYLDHQPSDGSSETKKKLRAGFQKTTHLFKVYFNEVPPTLESYTSANCDADDCEMRSLCDCDAECA